MKCILASSLALAGAVLWLSGSNVAGHPRSPQDDEAALIARARGIHERVITLDAHIDIDAENFRPACNYSMQLPLQVDLPKMRAGGLDVAFLNVFVLQGPLTPEAYDSAYQRAIEKFDAIRRLTTEFAPKESGLALTPAEVRTITASGRKVVVIGVENGYPLGTDLRRFKDFYDRGARYIGIVHNGHNQFGDSQTGERSNHWVHGGLSPLGRQAIAELNRLGIMIDVSHPSKGTIMQMLALSKAPVIASHSSVRALADMTRNIDDETLAAIKQNGGVVSTLAWTSVIKADPPQRRLALAALSREFGITAAPRQPPTPLPCPFENNGYAPEIAAVEALAPDRNAEYRRRAAEIDGSWPATPRATVRDFVDHIDYMVKRIGIDHVGISSDFEGGGGVEGWNNAAETFNVTLELVRRGYSEEQIAQIWSGNLLRVWEQVEQVAKGIQSGTIK